MNDRELNIRVTSSIYHQIQERGYATTVDVLMDIGVLSKEDYERWRFGKIDYLERVCKTNKKKLSEIAHEIRVYSVKNDLNPSWTYYAQWGIRHGKCPKLCFSKSGDEKIENSYATHYVKKQT